VTLYNIYYNGSILNSTGYTGLTQAYQVSSLAPNTGYTFAASAKNMIGTSAISTPTTQIYTYSDKASLGVSANSPTQITFTTTPPAGGASAYHIYYSNGSRLASSVATSYSSSVFSANTSYSFYVTSINTGGVENSLSSYKSNTASTTTYSGQATLAVAANNTAQITFTITAPTGGSSSYSIYYSNGTLLASSITLTSYSSSVFSANTAYSFYVSSFNSAGVQCLPANNSTTVSTTTYSGQAGLGLTPNSPSQITFTITAPAGGSSSYNIYYSNGTLLASSITLTSYSSSVFSANTAYSFYVSSFNSAGVQCLPANNSSTVSTTTYSGQATLAVAANNTAQITFTITAPTGGSSSYSIYYSNGTLLASSITLTSYSSSVFSANTAYSFYVSSFNSAGVQCLPANNSTTVSTTTYSGQAGLGLTPNSPSQITFSISAPVGGASGYNIYYSNGSLFASNVSTSYSPSVFSANTAYSFYVSSINSAGVQCLPANNSSTVSTTTYSGQASLSLSSSGPTQITFTIGAPAGGASSYNIYYSNGSFFASTVSTSYSSSVFSGSTTYSFYVSSINSAGVQCLPANNSAVASITTAASFPGVPSGISTSGVTSSQITVNWNAVATATYYNVYLNGGGPYTTSATSYVFTGLSQLTTYTFVVKAGNAGGENPSGASTSATTTAAYTPVVQRWNNNQVGPFYPSRPSGATKVQIYLRTNTYATGKSGYGTYYYSGPVMDFSSVSITINTPGNYTAGGTQTVTYSINGGGSVTIHGINNRTGSITGSPADWGYTQITWSA